MLASAVVALSLFVVLYTRLPCCRFGTFGLNNIESSRKSRLQFTSRALERKHQQGAHRGARTVHYTKRTRNRKHPEHDYNRSTYTTASMPKTTGGPGEAPGRHGDLQGNRGGTKEKEIEGAERLDVWGD